VFAFDNNELMSLVY